ncbi:hypothetical protein NE237_006833 [Protea cynaroides]|uniref:NB-ARC domain-containing protein n=1 Tax=Protea cynaroides TaxID=273540 RepID=A0A9Q0KNX3_9MAGN|nr:hypothetical protein NE237_006833 [Protea cynaroides]
MVFVWFRTQADEAFAKAWHSKAANVHFDGLCSIKSKVYLSPKLWYLRVTIIEAQDIILAEKGSTMERFPELSVKAQEAELLGGAADQVYKIQVEMEQIRDLAYDVEDIIESYILKANVGTYGFLRNGQGEGTNFSIERQHQLRQSHPHYDDEDVIGTKGNIKVLVAELIDTKGPHMVSIVGMGGLGKITLAKKVYNHDNVKLHFDCCSWSFIFQQFQVRTILLGIIRKFCNLNEGTRLEILNDEEWKEKLYKLLENKRYLVVLDDIWSTEAWDVLKSAIPKGKMGRKIMLTTRIKDVAIYADPGGFLHEPTCTEVKREVGKGNKCGGLPLAVVVLGGLLTTKKSIHEWEMVAKDIGEYLNKAQQQQAQQGVSWILSLSYHDLPYFLKLCFLYLGLYPEDTEVHKRQLIQMWIAKGFVRHSGQRKTKEEMGEECLLELINRSMVQVGRRSFRGKIQKCCLHDLVRDLCLWKAKEENFLCAFDGGSSLGDSSSSSTSMVESISNHRIRRHAIHFTCDRHVSMQKSRRSPHLRAFSLWSPSNPVESFVTLQLVCKKFNFLRVLELEGVMVESLPRSIGNLIHLRYLRLIGPWNAGIKVPPTVGNLRSLQFFILSNIERLPNMLWKMEQLTLLKCRT